MTYIQRGELDDVISNLCDMVSQMLPVPLATNLKPEEAKRFMLDAHGNFDLAVTMCVTKRRDLIDEFVKKYQDIPRERILQVQRSPSSFLFYPFPPPSLLSFLLFPFCPPLFPQVPSVSYCYSVY